jgi:hypothetical protein
MRFHRIVALLPMLAALAVPAQASETWSLSHISTSCSLAIQRSERVMVVMHERDAQHPDGGTLSLGFLSPALKGAPTTLALMQSVSVRLEFDTGETLENTSLILEADDPTLVIFKNDRIQRELDIVGKATRVRVSLDDRTDEFDLSGLGEALPSLVDCAKSRRS